MILQADEEGSKAIKVLCDIALKHSGLQVIQVVSVILNSIKPLPKKPGKKET